MATGKMAAGAMLKPTSTAMLNISDGIKKNKVITLLTLNVRQPVISMVKPSQWKRNQSKIVPPNIRLITITTDMIKTVYSGSDIPTVWAIIVIFSKLEYPKAKNTVDVTKVI